MIIVATIARRIPRFRHPVVLLALFVAMVVLMSMALVPSRRYGSTDIERKVEDFAVACGRYDATRGISDYRGVFARDPGMVGAYLTLNEYSIETGSIKSQLIAATIASQPRNEQSQINRVFALAYDGSYDEASTWYGRLRIKLRAVLTGAPQ